MGAVFISSLPPNWWSQLQSFLGAWSFLPIDTCNMAVEVTVDSAVGGRRESVLCVHLCQSVYLACVCCTVSHWLCLLKLLIAAYYWRQGDTPWLDARIKGINTHTWRERQREREINLQSQIMTHQWFVSFCKHQIILCRIFVFCQMP